MYILVDTKVVRNFWVYVCELIRFVPEENFPIENRSFLLDKMENSQIHPKNRG